MGYIGNRPTAVPLTSADIQDGVITAADLGANSVDSSELVDGSIDTSHLADNQVTLAKMAGLARGTLIYGDASGDPAALAVGSANEVLTHDGTDLAWAAASGFDVSSITGATALGATPADTDEFVLSDAGVLKRVDFSYLRENNQPYFSAFASASMNISTATTTTLTNIDTEVVDSGGTYDTSTCVWSPGSAGTYLIGGKVGWVTGGTSTAMASLRINLTTSIAFMKVTENPGTTESHQSICGIYYHPTAPTFMLRVYHNSGSTEEAYGGTSTDHDNGGTMYGFTESACNFWGCKIS